MCIYNPSCVFDLDFGRKVGVYWIRVPYLSFLATKVVIFIIIRVAAYIVCVLIDLHNQSGPRQAEGANICIPKIFRDPGIASQTRGHVPSRQITQFTWKVCADFFLSEYHLYYYVQFLLLIKSHGMKSQRLHLLFSMYE